MGPRDDNRTRKKGYNLLRRSEIQVKSDIETVRLVQNRMWARRRRRSEMRRQRRKGLLRGIVCGRQDGISIDAIHGRENAKE